MNIISGVFVFCLSILLVLPGCATEGLSKMKDGALELVGVSRPEAKKPSIEAKSVDLHIFAGRNLNADDRGRGTAVVLRIYRLKEPSAFMQASYDSLAELSLEKGPAAADAIDMKELVIKPGQELLRSEMLGGDAPYMGVVALFRKPSPDRWRLVFSSLDQRNAKGIVLGAHECALTVSQGVPFNAQLVSPGSLGGVLCR